MRFLQTNLINAASLTGSTEATSYAVSNLQDVPLASVWRTTATSGNVVMNLGSAQAATCLFIANHNITSGATITLEANSSDAWGAPPFSESITHDVSIMVKTFTSASYQYWRLVITDAANPDGYIKIGGLGLGAYVQTPDFADSMSIERMSTAKKFVTQGGQVQGSAGVFLRRVTVQIPYVSQAERVTLETFFETLDYYIPFYVQFDESCISEDPIYCTLEEASQGYQTVNTNPVGYTTLYTLMEAK